MRIGQMNQVINERSQCVAKFRVTRIPTRFKDDLEHGEVIYLKRGNLGNNRHIFHAPKNKTNFQLPVSAVEFIEWEYLSGSDYCYALNDTNYSYRS